MTQMASAMIQAAIKSGLFSEKKIKKNGEMKQRAYSNACWPRLRRGQSAYQQKEVK